MQDVLCYVEPFAREDCLASSRSAKDGGMLTTARAKARAVVQQDGDNFVERGTLGGPLYKVSFQAVSV